MARIEGIADQGAMNRLNGHGEERSDVAIHLDLWWIAAVG